MIKVSKITQSLSSAAKCLSTNFFETLFVEIAVAMGGKSIPNISSNGMAR